MERLFTLYNLDRDISVAKQVRLAGTSGARLKGLLGVTELDRESGLWIVPCEGVHTFGMKIALDVIFLDRKYRVRKIRTGMRANRIALCLLASSVVELAAGALAPTGTKVGDRLELREN